MPLEVGRRAPAHVVVASGVPARTARRVSVDQAGNGVSRDHSKDRVDSPAKLCCRHKAARGAKLQCRDEP
ncbi:hypothetical protein BRPE64_ACDS20300 [Caballeronia insecticola]|uniref:Uncharacterized protein n=1 Tax=Caballeronia insecticola TaxID=758793 RepID=R4WHX3_9BURK|nr:hypothetical protein BRPE64_ACDS20300 [Caballeronia insecticola]